MNVKPLLTKSFLASVALCVGTGGAWADEAAGSYKYFNTFDTSTGLTVHGTGSFTSETNARFGKVFQNVGGAVRTNYLEIPADVLHHSATSNQLTIGFWVNKKNATGYDWAPVFTAYESSDKLGASNWKHFYIEYRGIVEFNLNGPANTDDKWFDATDALQTGNGGGSVSVYNNNSGNDWLNDGEWHYMTTVLDASTTPQKITIYMDGEVANEWTLDGETNGQKLQTLFANASDLGYVCLGGCQARDWTDNDPAFAFDDLYITNAALTQSKIKDIMSEKQNSVVETYALTTEALTSISLDGDVISQAEGGTNVTVISASGSNVAERVALGDGWSLNKARILNGNWDGYFSVCDLKAGDIIKLSMYSNDTNPSANNCNSRAFVLSGNVVNMDGTALDTHDTYGGYLESNVHYLVTSDGHVDLHTHARNWQLSGLEVITVNPTVTRPSIASAAGMGYTALTITPGVVRGDGTGTVITKYSYVSAEDAKSNGSVYTEVLNPTTSGTIYTYSYIEGGDESDVVSLAYEVVTPTLNTPTAALNSLVASGSSYFRSVTLDTDVSNIAGDVTVSYKYSTDNSAWNDVDANPFTCPANTTYIKATATGCTDSEVLTITNCEFKRTSDMDFSDGTISLAAENGLSAYQYINSISFSDANGFNKLIIKKDYGLSYDAGNNNGLYSIAIPLDGQIMAWKSFKYSNSTMSIGSEILIDNENATINPSRDRYGNGTDQGMRTYCIYTPVDLVASASDVTVDGDGVVDLSGKAIYTGNISALQTAVAALNGVKTIKVGHVGYGVTAEQLNGLIPATQKNSVFVQLPANSFFDQNTDVANIRTNAGAIAKYDLADAKDYAAAAAFTPAAATYDRTFTQGVVSTVCLPFAIDTETAATLGKFYRLKSTTTTENVVFESVDETEALKPYLFVPAATGTITLPASTEFVAAGDVTTQTFGDVTLNGSISSSSISSTVYGFASSGELVTAESGTMNPFRAYLTTSSGARLSVYTFDDGITGIDGLKSEQEGAQFYNLQGVKVGAPAKGLYILNGKKVIIK